MNTSVKALFISSIIGFSTLSPVMADDTSGNVMPYPQGMMGYGMGPGMMNSYNPNAMSQGHGMGYGMMQSYGMGPGIGSGMGYHMNMRFSDSQIKQFNKISSNAMKTQSRDMRAIWKERQELGKLLAAETPDKKAISNAYDKLSQARKKVLMERIEMQHKMQNVLTKEQKEQMHEYRQNMMGN
ncbi:Spy/CpxP family protein refolding chaperone [Hydrogenovibrio sp. 3SP14C1]|uniref:Spy/CpxP family protein refolding chaperone n=1 Tax=Hydrogenovibrio sp. 3SP14C1 TaxID=3038774 RepID=UPI002417F8EE|nr:Spy/CpxP family protein refolding chaperone [Hydrogenovibrio sp. 3SP14C1]MDG4811765.1 Spy/CpxP family protein refolding chaperone [Hydrogenovibrio sp. 3SP14C1]